MSFTMSDFQTLKQAIFGREGLWYGMKKDLRQIVNLPSHFDAKTEPNYGTGTNLSTTILAMSILEAMSTLANINDSIKGHKSNYATDVVEAFGRRYLVKANPRYELYGEPKSIRLVWDAYRNGGLHKFLPKKAEIKLDDGRIVQIDFAVIWIEDSTRANRSMTLEEVETMRRDDKSLQSLTPKHLDLQRVDGNKYRFTIAGQALVLEVIEAVEQWATELDDDDQLKEWFIEGANAFELGRQPSKGSACVLKRLVYSV